MSDRETTVQRLICEARKAERETCAALVGAFLTVYSDAPRSVTHPNTEVLMMLNNIRGLIEARGYEDEMGEQEGKR